MMVAMAMDPLLRQTICWLLDVGRNWRSWRMYTSRTKSICEFMGAWNRLRGTRITYLRACMHMRWNNGEVSDRRGERGNDAIAHNVLHIILSHFTLKVNMKWILYSNSQPYVWMGGRRDAMGMGIEDECK